MVGWGDGGGGAGGAGPLEGGCLGYCSEGHDGFVLLCLIIFIFDLCFVFVRRAFSRKAGDGQRVPWGSRGIDCGIEF